MEPSNLGAITASPLPFRALGWSTLKLLPHALKVPAVHLSVPEAEANQPSSPEGLDNPHPLQADPTPRDQSAAQGPAVGGLGQVPALRWAG